MGYITQDEYQQIYGDISTADFARFEVLARRKLDNFTTGVDGFRKLRHAFPTDEDAVWTVKHCEATMIAALQIAENFEKASAHIVKTENGTHSNVITSVTAGNESVHYASMSQPEQAQESFYEKVIRDYLSGVCDANGVNLLYLGRYPYAVNVK